MLRNTFDIYKMLGLAILFFFCVIHWLVNKRSDYLVSRGSRDWMEHFKIMLLGNILVFICFVVSYVFYKQFTIDDQEGEERIGKIYVIIGFEVSAFFTINLFIRVICLVHPIISQGHSAQLQVSAGFPGVVLPRAVDREGLRSQHFTIHL